MHHFKIPRINYSPAFPSQTSKRRIKIKNQNIDTGNSGVSLPTRHPHIGFGLVIGTGSWMTCTDRKGVEYRPQKYFRPHLYRPQRGRIPTTKVLSTTFVSTTKGSNTDHKSTFFQSSRTAVQLALSSQTPKRRVDSGTSTSFTRTLASPCTIPSGFEKSLIINRWNNLRQPGLNRQSTNDICQTDMSSSKHVKTTLETRLTGFFRHVKHVKTTVETRLTGFFRHVKHVKTTVETRLTGFFRHVKHVKTTVETRFFRHIASFTNNSPARIILTNTKTTS